MCGIAGVYLKDPAFEVDLEGVLDSLLIAIEPRGDDATGFVAVAPEGDVEWHKAACDATTFVKYRRALPEKTRVIIAHTRWATQGLPAFIENNHPIKRGPFYIIHNGHVRNDDALFENADRLRFGQVDSEAIAARLASLEDLSELAKVVEEIEGDAAIAAVDERDPSRLVVARGNYSPLWVYNGKRIVLFGSTRDAVESTHKKFIGRVSYPRLKHVDSGVQMEWRDNVCITSSFEPIQRYKTKTYGSWSSSSGTHYGGYSWDDWGEHGSYGEQSSFWKRDEAKEGETKGELVLLGTGEKLDYSCDNCSMELAWKDVETRWDAKEGMTFMFCEDCAELWDWDEFGMSDEELANMDRADNLDTVIEGTAIELDDDDDTGTDLEVITYDDFGRANHSILKRFGIDLGNFF